MRPGTPSIDTASTMSGDTLMTARSVIPYLASLVSPSLVSLASACAFFSQHLGHKPYKEFSARTFCESLLNSPRGRNARVAIARRYFNRTGLLHRFLVLDIVQDDGTNFYLRLDCRPDRTTSRLMFALRHRGTSSALDTASNMFFNLVNY